METLPQGQFLSLYMGCVNETREEESDELKKKKCKEAKDLRALYYMASNDRWTLKYLGTCACKGVARGSMVKALDSRVCGSNPVRVVTII